MTTWFDWLEEQEPLEDREPVRVFPVPRSVEARETTTISETIEQQFDSGGSRAY